MLSFCGILKVELLYRTSSYFLQNTYKASANVYTSTGFKCFLKHKAKFFSDMLFSEPDAVQSIHGCYGQLFSSLYVSLCVCMYINLYIASYI